MCRFLMDTSSTPITLGSGGPASQRADLQRETQREPGVVRQKGKPLVLHPAQWAFDAAHLKVEIHFPIPAIEIAHPSPALAVKTAARLLASGAHRFFERRSSVSTKAGCFSSS
jgi:hypothetical protein